MHDVQMLGEHTLPHIELLQSVLCGGPIGGGCSMRTRPKWSVSSLELNLEECHEFTPGTGHLLSPSHPHHGALVIRREVNRDIELGNNIGVKV